MKTMNFEPRYNDLTFIYYPQKGTGERPAYDPRALGRDHDGWGQLTNRTIPEYGSFYFCIDKVDQKYKDILKSVDENDRVHEIIRRFQDIIEFIHLAEKADFPGYMFFLIKQDVYGNYTLIEPFDAKEKHYLPTNDNTIFSRNLEPGAFI